jgi:zinc-ribbon domain
MFCPKCATQNLDGASFCRTCGANISLVPQALTGQIVTPQAEDVVEGRGRRKRSREVTLDQSFKNIFMGVAFLLVSIVLSRSGMGQGWWFWLMVPAFSMMGTGIAQYIRVKDREKHASLVAPPHVRSFDTPLRNPDELMSPVPSVTEGTTRHLGVEAPTRHLDPSERK